MTKKPKLFNQEYQKQWSITHKYKHIHTGEHCTFEAYIAEYLIIRWVEAFNMEKPSYKFWTKGDRYHKPFMKNMKAAQGLARKFDEATIFAAIRSDRFKKIYHIGLNAKSPRGWKYNPVALEAVKQYDKEHKDFLKLCDKASKQESISVENKELDKRKTQSYNKKKTSINKLRNL